MIARVELVNWKSHGRSVFEFEPGTNVLIGKNGAGKSSVLEAIYYALFGRIPGRKFEHVLRRGSQEGEVRVSFVLEGRTYTVRRVCGPTGTRGAEIREGEKLLSAGKAEHVTEIVEKVLGMSPELFLQAVYAQQNGIGELLNMQGGERKKRMDKILGIYVFEEARKTLNSVITTVSRQLSTTPPFQLAAEIESLEKQTKELEGRIEEEQRKLEESRRALEEGKNILKTLKERIKELERKYGELRRYQEELAKLRGELGRLEEELRQIVERFGEPRGGEEEREKELQELLERVRNAEKLAAGIKGKLEHVERRLEETKKRLEEVGGVEGDPEEKKRELETVKEELSKISKHIGETRAKLSELERRKRELEEKAKPVEIPERDVESEVKELREKLSALEKELGALLAEIEREERIRELLGKGERCPLCFSPLTEERREEIAKKHEEMEKEARRRAEKVREELERVKKSLEELEALQREMEELKRKKKEAEEARKQLEEVERAIEELKGLLKSMEEREKELMKRGEELEAFVKALEDRRKLEEEFRTLLREREALAQTLKEAEEILAGVDIEALQKELEAVKERRRGADIARRIRELRERVEELVRKVEVLGEVEEALAKAREEHARRETEVRGLEERIKELEARIKGDLSLLQRLKESLDAKKRMYERMKKLLTLKGQLERLRSVFMKAQEIVRAQRVGALNRAMNVIWAHLYPYRDFPEVRIRPTERDYVVEVRRRNGEWVGANVLSGGERSMVALTLRIALSSLLARHVGWLFLDEPTHNLDTSATESLAEMLRELPNQGLFSQIILITHKEELQGAATGAVYLLDRNKGEGEVTKVRRVQ